MVVVEEPITEANDSGQTEANTPSGSASLLSQILVSMQQSGLPNLQLGAGTGTSQANSLAYIQEYVALPVNFIDFHVYPINDNFLTTTMQIVSTAAAAGKPVAMTECWLWKVADSEVGVLSADEVRARDPFSFWAPLDAQFIQTMQNLAHHSQMLFMDPFNTEDFSAYLPYSSATDDLTPGAITSQESAQASLDEQQAISTSTAISYYTSLVSPPDKTAPAVPPGVTGTSDNPNTAAVNWNASTDNVGVSGYYVSRNGSVVGTTASQYYQDTGLTQSTTYTYTVEAFDMGGNVSAPSQRVNVTTSDLTPPSTPGSLAATATSSQKVTLTWSPSTDNVAVGSYIVFWGLSPAALTQAGRTAGTTTSFPSSSLTAGSTNYYGVEAVDTSGNASAMSAVVSAKTPMPPAPPTSLAATAASAARVALTWSAAVGGGLPIQNYHIYRGTSSSTLSQVAVGLQTSYSDSSVTAGTTYYYAVEATDTGSDVSPMSAILPVAVPNGPSAPSGLVATPVTATKISLTWSLASGALPIRAYTVFRGATASNLTQVATVAQPAYNDNSGSLATTYYYTVQATDTGGDLSPMSATVSATTLGPPSAPTGLVATALSKTVVALTWSAAQGGTPLASFTIFRGSTPASLASLKSAAATATSANDNAAVAGATYYYGIQANDTGGNASPMSAVVSVTTP
jgi:fibronectin type 3 domain-containing protein